MINPLNLIPIVVSQKIGTQQLIRETEPTPVTSQAENVVQYDQVMKTKLAINYALGLEVIHRARSALGLRDQTAIDLACGPAHFTICLEKYLHFSNICGIDLSQTMIDVARKNAKLNNLENKCHFEIGDVLKLEKFENESFDLVSFTDAAHHMSDLESVARTVQEMERIAKPDGLVFVMDLVRLRTDHLTMKYVNLLGADYNRMGLPDFFKDFRDSMYAAWTTLELNSVIPKNSRRIWCHMYPRFLPSVQFLIGLPQGRKNLFVQNGLPWEKSNHPIQKSMKIEWQLARIDLLSGYKILSQN